MQNKVIDIIKCNADFFFDLNQKCDLENLKKIIFFLRENDFKQNNVIHFIKHNFACLSTLLKILPFPIILNLYQEFGFFENYWSDDLLSLLFKKSDYRFRINLIENINHNQEFIILNNQFNSIYNFTDKIINKRLDILRNELKCLNLDEYFIGKDGMLFLGYNGFHKSNVIPEKIFIKLFPKNKVINFNNNDPIHEDKDGNLIYEKNNFLCWIDRKYHLSHSIIFYNLGEHQEKIIYDGFNIFCFPDFYSKLDTGIAIGIGKNNLDYVIDKDNLKIFKWRKKTLKKSSIKKDSIVLNKCYVCKKLYDKEITFDRYIDMCLDCGLFNYEKRILKANLESVIAFVSGIRQKIGFRIALKLLRCGAKVIGTTRFPNFTIFNFSKELDFDNFKHRLILFPCNFLNIKEVQKLINFLKTQNLNIIINNACQTIRPSNEYISKIVSFEKILNNFIRIETDNTQNYLLTLENEVDENGNENEKQEGLIIRDTQQILSFKKIETNEIIKINEILKSKEIQINQFNDIKDINIRETSSWNQKIDDIDPGEILEVIAINQTIPILIINQVKKTMSKPKFIINVTALEGQFSTSKEPTHAHTNMCKAALNMLIRTISEENDADQYVYAIDPGFVTGINPQNDHYPLSDEDGAARILDPIIQFFRGDPLPRDFIKIRNFKSEPW